MLGKGMVGRGPHTSPKSGDTPPQTVKPHLSRHLQHCKLQQQEIQQRIWQISAKKYVRSKVESKWYSL